MAGLGPASSLRTRPPRLHGYAVRRPRGSANPKGMERGGAIAEIHAALRPPQILSSRQYTRINDTVRRLRMYNFPYYEIW